MPGPTPPLACAAPYAAKPHKSTNVSREKPGGEPRNAPVSDPSEISMTRKTGLTNSCAGRMISLAPGLSLAAALARIHRGRVPTEQQNMKVKAYRSICALLAAVVFAACASPSSPSPQQSAANGADVSTPTSAPAQTPAETPSNAAAETSTPVPAPDSQPAPVWPDIVLVETLSGLRNPVDFAHARDGSGRVYVVEQIGLVQEFTNGSQGETPFMDIRDRVNCCGERGLLGIAFPADFSSSRTLYVNYTTTDPGSLHTRVSRFRLRPDLHQVDPDSEEILMQFHQPWRNHNGGQIAFGPDGYLWIGTGDGGSAADPQDNGQKGQTLLGKLLRIDVSAGSSAPYSVPVDNPFVGNDDFLDEIWAYGLRNPWRFSFDRETGDLYIADVGQNAWEEVNFQPADSRGGENYGWRIMEGLHCFNPSSGCSTAGLTMPVAEYDRVAGLSITGGYVYRGQDYSSLQGIYFFADYVTGNIWGLRQVNGLWESELLLDSPYSISSFGEDEAGNLYLVDYSGAIYHIQAADRN